MSSGLFFFLESFMTRQFFAYLFEAVFVAVFDQVDIAFGNGISIDSIVALSTFTVITWVIHHLADRKSVV